MSQEIQFILYNLPDENGKVQVIIRDETLWCTQKAMAQLFGVDRTVISKHLKNIFDSSELQQDSVCAKLHILQKMAKLIIHSSIILMPLYLLVIVLIRCRQPVSVNGLPRYSMNILKGICS